MSFWLSKVSIVPSNLFTKGGPPWLHLLQLRPLLVSKDFFSRLTWRSNYTGPVVLMENRRLKGKSVWLFIRLVPRQTVSSDSGWQTSQGPDILSRFISSHPRLCVIHSLDECINKFSLSRVLWFVKFQSIFSSGSFHLRFVLLNTKVTSVFPWLSTEVTSALLFDLLPFSSYVPKPVYVSSPLKWFRLKSPYDPATVYDPPYFLV